MYYHMPITSANQKKTKNKKNPTTTKTPEHLIFPAYRNDFQLELSGVKC